MLITVSDDGRVFFRVDGKHTKKRVLELMAGKYETEFSEEEKEAFSLSSGVGMPIEQLRGWLATELSERREIVQPGIPMDSTNNQLEDWIVHARMANPMFRVAIKGDQKAPYKTVRRVIDTLVENGVNRFNLVTDLEKEI